MPVQAGTLTGQAQGWGPGQGLWPPRPARGPPPQPPAPGPASYIRRRAACRRLGQPHARGPASGWEPPPPPPGPRRAPGSRFPALALTPPQKPTHRHHNKGGNAGHTWGGLRAAIGLAVRPRAQRRTRQPGPDGRPGGRRPAGRGRFEVLLTLVRQLVELRHLERAAPLFQRLPAAVHCGAGTGFEREVRMSARGRGG